MSGSSSWVCAQALGEAGGIIVQTGDEDEVCGQTVVEARGVNSQAGVGDCGRPN